MTEKQDYTVKHTYGDDQFSPEKTQLFRQPDVLCVDEYLQVYRARPAETPERRLLAAILSDAIDCYIRDCCAGNRRKKKSFREAEEWFFSTDDYGVFSFENVCESLQIEPGYIRRGLLRYNPQNSLDSKPRITRAEASRNGLRMAS